MRSGGTGTPSEITPAPRSDTPHPHALKESAL